MSTDTAFGPRKCPTCGQENPSDAAHCCYCLTPLSQADKVTDYLPNHSSTGRFPPHHNQFRRSALAILTAWVSAAGLVPLVLLSAFIAFVGVCTPIGTFGVLADGPPQQGIVGTNFLASLAVGIPLGLAAATATAYFVARYLFSRRRE
jgi:hypothetical protein